MKTIFSCKLVLLFACLFILASRVNAQDDMGKPAPIDNETMKMLVGTWKSDPYDFMGAKWTETAVHSMKLNGQYMYIELSAVSDKSQTKNAIIYIAVNKDGSWKGWGLNEWGYTSTMTATANGNKISATTQSGDWGSEIREIEINGNTMVHNINWNIKKDGKDMAIKQTVTYHKQ
jgi:hypothetical protein